MRATPFAENAVKMSGKNILPLPANANYDA
jgi:hypothetical protein